MLPLFRSDATERDWGQVAVLPNSMGLSAFPFLLIRCESNGTFHKIGKPAPVNRV